jgi:hypothetical protein
VAAGGGADPLVTDPDEVERQHVAAQEPRVEFDHAAGHAQPGDRGAGAQRPGHQAAVEAEELAAVPRVHALHQRARAVDQAHVLVEPPEQLQPRREHLLAIQVAAQQQVALLLHARAQRGDVVQQAARVAQLSHPAARHIERAAVARERVRHR